MGQEQSHGSTKDVLAEIAEDLFLTFEEVEDWYKQFVHKYPKGKITRKRFVKENIRRLKITNWDCADFFSHIFDRLDLDKNGKIDFKVRH